MRVPVLVEGVELRELVAALLEPDRLGELDGKYQSWNAKIEDDGRLVPEIERI